MRRPLPLLSLCLLMLCSPDYPNPRAGKAQSMLHSRSVAGLCWIASNSECSTNGV